MNMLPPLARRILVVTSFLRTSSRQTGGPAPVTLVAVNQRMWIRRGRRVLSAGGGAALVVEAERVERAVRGADVDLPQAGPEAAWRGLRRHAGAARPQPGAGGAVVGVE